MSPGVIGASSKLLCLTILGFIFEILMAYILPDWFGGEMCNFSGMRDTLMAQYTTIFVWYGQEKLLVVQYDGFLMSWVEKLMSGFMKIKCFLECVKSLHYIV